MTDVPVASRVHRSSAGMTIVEMLIAAAILGVILLVLGRYFQVQLQTSQQLESRAEVDAKVRGVAELIMQDLQHAGSLAYYDGVEPKYVEDDPSPTCKTADRSGCVVVNGPDSDLRIFFVTSLLRMDGEPCRKVDYELVDGTLYRRDVPCDSTVTSFEGYELADGIVSVDLSFICHNPESLESDIADCYSETTYPREATVSVLGEAERSRVNRTATVTLSTSTPNLRPPVDYLAEPDNGG